MAMPELYEEGTAVAGTGAISIPRGILGAGYVTLVVVQTANQALTGVNAGWTLIGTVGVGTAGAAGATAGHVYWNSDHSNAFTADDPGDHWVGRILGLLNCDLVQPINWVVTATVATPQAAASVVLQDTTVQNCLIWAWSFGAIDSAAFEGSSNITNASVDTVAFGGWIQTTQGVGGGYYGGQGTKAVAGTCGTMDLDAWTTTTAQANIAFAISDTETPADTLTPTPPPVYPDYLARLSSKALLTAAFVGPLLVTAAPTVPELSWQPTYPDSVQQTSRPVSLSGEVAPIAPPEAPLLAWSPTFPAALPARTAPFSGATIVHAPLPAPELSWQPTYPALLPDRARADVTQNLVAPVAPPTLAFWQATYPDLLLPSPPLTPSGQTAPIGLVDVVPLFWQATYPAFLPPPPPLPPSGQTAPVGLVDVIPQFWQATYPDRLEARFPSNLSGLTAPVTVTAAALLLDWQPHFPDLLPAPAPLLSGGQTAPIDTTATPLLLNWQPQFPAFLPARHHAAPDSSVAPPDVSAPTLITGWDLVVGGPYVQAPAWRPAGLSVGPVMLVPAPSVGGSDIAIHTPDEVPPGVAVRISVEYLVAGVAVAFDAPGPALRVYHLDSSGAQVVDMALATMTQYGANLAWYSIVTPTSTGVHMLDVRGTYLGTGIQRLLPLTVRSKFDPIALALDGLLVARNGDV